RRRVVEVRQEGRGRGLRRPRHRGHSPARGGTLPRHRHQRLLRRRSLPGRNEGLRQGERMSRVMTGARPPIAAATLRNDTWRALPVTVVVVLGSFIVYSTWAALQ